MNGNNKSDKRAGAAAMLFLIAAAMLCSFSMTACGKTDDASHDVTDYEETETSADTITFDGSYTVIRPDELERDEVEAARGIIDAIGSGVGNGAPSFETDFVKRGVDPDSVNPREILVGRTNRSASARAYAMLDGEHQFALGVLDGRLVCVGKTPALTKTASEFLQKLINNSDGGLTLPMEECKVYKAEPQYEYAEFTNPILPSGADPWVIRDGDTYYYCYSGGNGVYVSAAKSLPEITPDGGVKVYTAPENTMYSAEYWAPELHKIKGKWYIYVAADDGDNYNHRMYVLECTGDTPTDEFKMVGKLTDSTDKWAIDGTVLQYGGECYFVWSGWEGDVNVSQNIYIAHMKSPTEIDSERVLLSKPDLRFERQGGTPFINEGPVALLHGDSVHIIYSGSGSWSDYYCLGKLSFGGGDIMDPAAWTKSDKAVFERTDKVFGPGHCSFTTAPDDTVWMVYHANEESGTGWGGRSVWIKPIEWDGDEPVLGTPPESGTVMRFPTICYDPDKVSEK